MSSRVTKVHVADNNNVGNGLKLVKRLIFEVPLEKNAPKIFWFVLSVHLISST